MREAPLSFAFAARDIDSLPIDHGGDPFVAVLVSQEVGGAVGSGERQRLAMSNGELGSGERRGLTISNGELSSGERRGLAISNATSTDVPTGGDRSPPGAAQVPAELLEVGLPLTYTGLGRYLVQLDLRAARLRDRTGLEVRVHLCTDAASRMRFVQSARQSGGADANATADCPALPLPITFESVALQPGWWRTGPTSVDSRACLISGACIGTPACLNSTMNCSQSVCNVSRTGPYCDVCATGTRPAI